MSIAIGDISSQRAKVRMLEEQLQDSAAARAAWTKYVESLRPVVKMAEQNTGYLSDMPEFWKALSMCDEARLLTRNAIHRVQAYLPTRVELAPFLETNLTIEPDKLLDFIADRTDVDVTEVKMSLFDAQVREASALLDRIEGEVHKELSVARTYLEESEHGFLTLLALVEKWRRQTSKYLFLRAFWWLFADHLKATILGLIAAGAAVVWLKIRH